MGRRGPPPTPLEILELRGARSAISKRRKRGTGVKGGPGTPRCPSWLDVEAKAAWRRTVPLLRAMNVLTLVDGNALAKYCQLWSRWRKAETFLREHGTSYAAKDADGKVKGLVPFPEVAIAANLAQQLTRIEGEFGMTPSARTRVRTEPIQVYDPKAAEREKYFA